MHITQNVAYISVGALSSSKILSKLAKKEDIWKAELHMVLSQSTERLS